MNPLLALCITAIVGLVAFRSVRRVLNHAGADALAAPFAALYPQLDRMPAQRRPPYLGADDARIRAELHTLADYLAEQETAR